MTNEGRNDILCPACGRKCGEWKNGFVEIIRGGRALRIYEASCIVTDCENCRKTFDISGRWIRYSADPG